MQGTIDMLREIDPDTKITYHRLREWILNGTVPHVLVGTKRLINVDKLIHMLESGHPMQPEQPDLDYPRNRIRRIG